MQKLFQGTTGNPNTMEVGFVLGHNTIYIVDETSSILEVYMSKQI